MKSGAQYWVPAITAVALAAAGASLALERRLTIVEERKPDRTEVAQMIDERLDGLAKRLEDVTERLERTRQ